jgi:hypothetical protein
MGRRLVWLKRSVAWSSDAARAPERSDRENQHGGSVNQSETKKPSGGAAMPFAPGGDCPVYGEHAEECAGSFMEKLANGAPDNTQRDFDGVPQDWIEAGRHARILVQIEEGADVDFGYAGSEMRLVKRFALRHHL